MRLGALFFVLAACASRAPRATPQPGPPSSTATAGHEARDGARERAHKMLIQHCGECHEGHRPSAVADALHAFDLDQPDWPERFDARRFDVALGRLADKPERDKAIFLAFRDAHLLAGRGPSAPER